MTEEEIFSYQRSLYEQVFQDKPILTDHILYNHTPLIEIYHVVRDTNLYGFPLLDIMRELQKYTLPNDIAHSEAIKK